MTFELLSRRWVGDRLGKPKARFQSRKRRSSAMNMGDLSNRSGVSTAQIGILANNRKTINDVSLVSCRTQDQEHYFSNHCWRFMGIIF
jgi:hypothetical protein